MSTKYTFIFTDVANCTLTGLFHQITDIDMEIVIELDEIHGGFGFHLVSDYVCPFGAISWGIAHMFAYQAIYSSSWL